MGVSVGVGIYVCLQVVEHPRAKQIWINKRNAKLLNLYSVLMIFGKFFGVGVVASART